MATKTLIPSQVGAALQTCFGAKRAVMVHGDPGIGKSQVVQQVADKLFASAYGCKVLQDGSLVDSKGKSTNDRPWFKDVRAALLDAVDLRGLPHIENGKATWAVPDFLPTDKRGGVLFLDEINRGTEMVANACFSLVLDGSIGEYKLPSTWVVASAVNDRDGGARKMSGALRARFVHVDQVTNLQDVCNYANDRDWSPEVVAFLRFRPELLHKYDKDAMVSPNPRGWEFVSQIVKQNPPKDLAHALAQGVVGEAAAGEFAAFLQLYKGLVSLDTILLDPEHAPIPDQPSTRYAVATGLARRVSEKNFPVVKKYLDRMPKEYAVCSVVDARRRCPAIQSTAAFTKWCIENDQVFG